MKKVRDLPPGVYRDKSRVYYKEYLGMANGKRVFSKSIRIGPPDMPLELIWKEYECLTRETECDLNWLVDKYFASAQFKQLARATQGHYRAYAKAMLERPIKGGSTFGDVFVTAVTPRTIRRYLDMYEAKIQANRHIQFLKSVFSWGRERYEIINENPCHGVRLNKQVPRDRYVTDEEYSIVYRVAKTMRVPYFAPAMELAYLSRARRSEVFSYTWDDVLDDGLFLERGKGSENELTLWTLRLREAVAMCHDIHPNTMKPHGKHYLIHDKAGLMYRKDALDSSWRRVIAKAMDKGAYVDGEWRKLKERFTFHDLKAKGISDHATKHGGHRSERMRRVYDRLPEKIEATK